MGEESVAGGGEGMRQKRRELNGHEWRSGTTIAGWGAILFSLPFVGVGVFVVLVAAGIVFGDQELEAPRMVLWGVGVAFGSAGLWVLTHGVRSQVQSMLTARRRRRHPQEPWLWDHGWNQRRVRTGELRRMLKGVGCAVFLAAFLAPFNWWAFGVEFTWLPVGDNVSNPIVVAVVCLFDLGLVACLVGVLYNALRYLKYGNSTLELEGFPCHLGDEFRASLRRAGRLRSFRSLKLTLRCVEEAFESKGDNSTVKCYSVWQQTQSFTPDRLRLLEGEDLPIRFQLPEQAPATRLSERPPRYWELEVKADTPGIDFAALFLVPVYESRREAGKLAPMM